jgi:S-adenosylmethionine:tRNA ribosyltransferase-isomerase
VFGLMLTSKEQESTPVLPEAYALTTYQYELPRELIAQEPHPTRDNSRLLKIDRRSGALSNHTFKDLPQILKPSDLVVLNETRVIPAALHGHKPTGGRVDLLVLQPAQDVPASGSSALAIRACMARSSKPLGPGTAIVLETGQILTVKSAVASGRVLIQFPVSEDGLLDFLHIHGSTPLPPYISAEGRDVGADRTRYQTVYARVAGSVAAPTAGLHFTEELLAALERRGIAIVRIVLHVGPGTFIPVRETDIRRHKMESEIYEISEDAARALSCAQQQGRRIIAVGTTTVRALESAALAGGEFRTGIHSTDLFIFPGYMFRAVRGMVTNFHLPGSTLLMLVCAFGGTSRVLAAYLTAVGQRYRFCSYGDASVIVEE